MDFETALREQCEERGGPRAKKILKVLDMPKGKRRTRILANLEDHARAHLVGVGAADSMDEVDFGEIDWNSFFDGLIKFLTALLPLILPLFT